MTTVSDLVNEIDDLEAFRAALLVDPVARQAAQRLRYDWEQWARPEQLQPDGDWTIWLILAGRGFGKTRTGAEWVRHRVEREGAMHIALIGQTAADVRDVMIEGESGLLAVCPPWDRPKYEPSKRRLTWANGARATAFSGDAPDQLRGPQHDTVFADEPAKWQYSAETWGNLEMGLRLGARPRCVATTTPRPIPIIRRLVADPDVHVTRGSSYDNFANLAPHFIDRIRRRYEGTRLGRQELHAEILEDAIGALWSRDLIERGRRPAGEVPHLHRIAVGVDPQGTRTPDDDERGDVDAAPHETGIVVMGLGDDGHGYVLEDASGDYSPQEWAERVDRAYRDHQANWIVAETNYGGEMVAHTLRAVNPSAPVVQVRATRGKARRAEPIVALYEQGRVHHVGLHAVLEDEMCTWEDDPSQPSPNRLDALVWAAWQLLIHRDEDFPHYDPARHTFRRRSRR